LSKNLTASADYLFVRGVKLARTRNVNLLPPIVLTPQNSASLGIPDPTPQQIGREVFGPGRIDPAFDAMNLIEDSASSTYHGLSFSVNRQIEDSLCRQATHSLKPLMMRRILQSNFRIPLTSEANEPFP